MNQPLDTEQVLAEELKVIRDRRVYLKFGRLPGRPSTGSSAESARKKALEMGLTGLAFSGGGIRSATFNLGILQGLARLGLLPRFDYLSTVSGGGYIGSWLAAWVKRERRLANVERQLRPSRAEQAQAGRPLEPVRRFRPVQDRAPDDGPPAAAYFERGRVVDEEPEPIHHIRSYSNYLAPRPGLDSADTWALLAIYLRNFVINSMTLLPATVILVALVRLVVWYFAQSTGGGAGWLLGVNVVFALAGLLASVAYIIVVLTEVSSSRQAAAERAGVAPPPARFTKKWLHIVVILPLFLSAIAFTWMFTIDPRAKPADVAREHADEETPVYRGLVNLFGILPNAGELRRGDWPRVGAIAVGVALVAALLASVVFAWIHREQWKERPLAATLRPAALGFFGTLLFASLALLFLNPPDLGSGPRLSGGLDEVVTAVELAIATGVVVGLVPFVLYFSSSARMLLGWEREGRSWAFRDRVAYVVRLAVVPILAGFNGGLVYFLAALGTAKLVWHQPWHVATFGPPMFIVAVVVAAITNVGLLGHCQEEDEREWWASLTGLLMQYALAWLALFGILIYGIPAILAVVGRGAWIAAAAWAAISQAGAMSSHGEQSGIAVGGAAMAAVRKVLRVLAPPVFLIGLLLLVAGLVHVVVDDTTARAGADPVARYWRGLRDARAGSLAACLGAGAAVLILAVSLVDVNLFSLNAMYANRLVRCYLGASRRKQGWKARWGGDGRAWVPSTGGAPTGVDPKARERDENLITGFDINDDIPLYHLRFTTDVKQGDRAVGRAVSYEGPYPLFNTALNLVAGQELALKDRKADSFVLSPWYCGSVRTGYRELPDPASDPAPDMTLGRAVAISGAAADPNMGGARSLPETMLMTVFNARLGRWLENPARVGEDQTWRARGPSTGGLLLREFLGLTDEGSAYVHLSDGGHFENLGVYELVRRRCRFIVACDAGQDGDFLFEDLAGLIRKCRTDFGVRIELDISPIKPQPAARSSRWHCAVGTIHYEDVEPETPPGVLVYIKASMTGDEPPDIQNYAMLHPEFPHQTTADQFFDESQFESYRALGFHIAHEVFFGALAGSNTTAPRPPRDVTPEQKCLLGEAEELAGFVEELGRRGGPVTPELDGAKQVLGRAGRLEDCMTPTFLECRAMVLAAQAPALADWSSDEEDALRETADWYWNWENRTLFSEVRRRWFPPPPDLESNYEAATRAFGELQAALRTDPKLRQLSAELYPELEADGTPRPRTLGPASQEVAELHAVNEILIAMEQAWLGVKLEGYPEHPMNRGYLNVFRRCSGSRTVHKHWPTVRSGLNQEFVQFCERELKLPGSRPDVKPYDDVESPAHVRRAMELLGEEFAREWPREDPLSEFLKTPKRAWVILNGSVGGDAGAGTAAVPCGLIAVRQPEDPHKPSELFVWIRGPYRNVGIGRRCVEQVYPKLKPVLEERPVIRVRYPDRNPTSLSDRSRRDLWLNFFQHYDFIENELASAREGALILELHHQ